MNKKEIWYSALDEIQDVYLLEAARKRNRQGTSRRRRQIMRLSYGIAAACVAVIFAAALIHMHRNFPKEGDMESNAAATLAAGETAENPGETAENPGETAENPGETAKIPGVIVQVLEEEYTIQVFDLQEEPLSDCYLAAGKFGTEYREGEIVLVEVALPGDVLTRTFKDVTRKWFVPRAVTGIERFEGDGVFCGTLENGRYEYLNEGINRHVMCYSIRPWDTETENFLYQYETNATMFDTYMKEGDQVVVRYDPKTFELLNIKKLEGNPASIDWDAVHLNHQFIVDSLEASASDNTEYAWIAAVDGDQYKIAFMYLPSGWFWTVKKDGTDFQVGQMVRVKLVPFEGGQRYMITTNTYQGFTSKNVLVREGATIEAIP